MATFRADINIRSALTAQAQELENAQDVVTALRSSLQQNLHQKTDQEPPRKRQRRLEIHTPATQRLDDSATVVLVCMEIHLCLLGNEGSPSTRPLDPSLNSIPVKLAAINQSDDSEYGLSLSANPLGADPVHLRLVPDSLDPILPHLERLYRLQNKSSLGRSSDEDIAWPRCSLGAASGESQTLLLRVEILWAPERSYLQTKQSAHYAALLGTYLAPEKIDVFASWSPQDFYENVHIPPADLEIAPQVQSNVLESHLYPFQKRAVQWLLQREGANVENGTLVAQPEIQSVGEELPVSFHVTADANGQKCYVSHVHGVVIKNPWSLLDYRPDLRGGILAEEMGLGKTVELIALICLHKRTEMSKTPRADGLTNSGSTLIITPSHILQQWINEIETHAPHLQVLHYKGLSSPESTKQGNEYTVENLMEYDVVLTTYNVLAREVYYADSPPERYLRNATKYKPRRSPLVLTNWWRVCLDEAQMIESGASQAARVARLLPRVNAWAVSGTPLKKDVDDLLGLLIFLRYEPYCSSKKIWSRVDKETFKQIFSQITLRHTKHMVAHELRLPAQKRMVITMPFTVVEEQNYAQLFQQMCELIGLNPDGSPAQEEYNPDSEQVIDRMRSWLRRLRETCLHPQVGSRNRRALGRGQGPLRTVGEVLEIMIEQNETEVRAEERKHVLSQVLRGHIVAYDKSNMKRSQDALAIYQDALSKAEGFVAECRNEYALEKARIEANPEAVSTASGAEESVYETDADGKSGEQTGRLATIRKQLRSALEVLHVCTFFVATSYFQIKENEELTKKDSEEFVRLEELEAKYYDEAKAMRKEMLHESHSKASRVMRKIASNRKAHRFTDLLEIPLLEDSGGIENRKVLDKMDEVSAVLDKQAKHINEWRTKVIEILLKPLVDEDEGQETTGDEYEDSTKLQDELYVYIAVLRAMVADRHRSITGQTNFLIDGEVKTAIKEAKEDKGHAPELLLKVMGVRENLKPKKEDGSLRGIISELRTLATDLNWRAEGGNMRARAELSIVEKQLKEIQTITSVQSKPLESLEKEQELFRNCMNLRLEYYRQLQAVSDTVAPWKDDLDENLDTAALEEQIQREEASSRRLAGIRTKRRFLQHLRAESSEEKEGRICVICTDTFENGVLTVCGHQYCKDCIRAWYSEHRTCPECRRRLNLVDFHEITYKPQELRAKEEATQHPLSPSKTDSNMGSPSSTSGSIYSDISSTTMDEIKAIDLNGSYGTKIDTIARHLLWLREHDPGAKSIIFSQYSDFLSVLSSALAHFKIGHVSIRDAGGVEKFRRDPSKECFLLDAKSNSSGLNLINATHVFLCEPLINAAIELQAIARVHRIGQLRQTTVYMYLISDTVEEAIYDISVSRRLAHIGNASSSSSKTTSRAQTPGPLQESALDKANSLEIEQAPLSTLLANGRQGGEVVDRDDLWKCLFGKTRINNNGVPNVLQFEVDRHLRAEAAERRANTDV